MFTGKFRLSVVYAMEIIILQFILYFNEYKFLFGIFYQNVKHIEFIVFIRFIESTFKYFLNFNIIIEQNRQQT